MTENVRDRLIRALHQQAGLQAKHLHRIQLVDSVRDPEVDFLEARDAVLVPGRTRPFPLDDAARACLEDYLNAAPQGRPFLDYRPDIGSHLFPSARTGGGLSRRTLRRVIGVVGPAVVEEPSPTLPTQPEEEGEESEEDVGDGSAP